MNTVIPFSPLIVYVATQEELSRHLPLLNAQNRPVLVLCSAEIDEEMEVNENILAVAVEDVDDEELWPLLERLHPEADRPKPWTKQSAYLSGHRSPTPNRQQDHI